MKIELVEHDSAWARAFDAVAARIRSTLLDRALSIEHVGSTSVPGLAAKPIIDIVLVVSDSAAEDSYFAAIEALGFELRHREPDWHEHRVFKGADPLVNLHVFSWGCPEIARMLTFRDHLRVNTDDRALYERTKRELAAREWTRVQDYADAKGPVVEEIIARAHAR